MSKISPSVSFVADELRLVGEFFRQGSAFINIDATAIICRGIFVMTVTLLNSRVCMKRMSMRRDDIAWAHQSEYAGKLCKEDAYFHPVYNLRRAVKQLVKRLVHKYHVSRHCTGIM